MIVNQHEHSISFNEMYIQGAYSEKVSENSKQEFYKNSSKFDNVLVNINEISSVNADFDQENMTKEEDVSICSYIFWLTGHYGIMHGKKIFRTFSS